MWKDHPQGSVHKPRLSKREQSHFNVSWTNSHRKSQQESKVTEYSPSSTHHLQSQPVVKQAMLLGVFIKFMNFHLVRVFVINWEGQSHKAVSVNHNF